MPKKTKRAPMTLGWILYFQGSQDSQSCSSHLPVPQAAMKGGLEGADNRQNSAALVQPVLMLLACLYFHLKDDGLIDNRKLQNSCSFFFNLALQPS